MDGGVRVLVAIADVSATVVPGSAVDAHAGVNTTSVYTPGRIFPMLPDRLSTDLTSLNPAEDRLAVVVGMTVDAGGAVVAEDVRRALVHNHAKLAYPSVGAWLQGEGGMPPALAAVEGLAENLRLQHTVAQRLRARRREQGALELETLEVQRALRRRRRQRPRRRAPRPRQGAHRGLHDRRQRRRRALPRRQAVPGAAPRRARAGALAAHRRPRRPPRLPSSPRSPTRRRSTPSWTSGAQPTPSASPTSPSRSSSCSAAASTRRPSRASPSTATSASP